MTQGCCFCYVTHRGFEVSFKHNLTQSGSVHALKCQWDDPHWNGLFKVMQISKRFIPSNNKSYKGSWFGLTAQGLSLDAKNNNSLKSGL